MDALLDPIIYSVALVIVVVGSYRKNKEIKRLQTELDNANAAVNLLAEANMHQLRENNG